MPGPRGALLLGSLLSASIFVLPMQAQSTQNSANPPTLQVTSRLVFLDVTVLDKKGRPVVQGLSKEDFAITEEKRPQRIFSFEAPPSHASVEGSVAEVTGQKAPLTIFVLDRLNSDFVDFAYIRYSMRKYLMTQAATLASPAEMMVLGNESLEMVQGYTRNREDLLRALEHIPTALPYKHMNAAFYAERFGQSIDALQRIALQSKGVPGRKNIVWVGHGGPGLATGFLPGSWEEKLQEYVRETTNLLVDARVSLFVLYPGLKAQAMFTLSEGAAEVDLGDNDPFAGDVNFGVFVNETGGKLFYNRNDVDGEIAESEMLGSNYYTLTYQPQGGVPNGKFRRVRVTVRNPKLHVVTKAGYYAPDPNRKLDPDQRTLLNLVEAAQSTIPFPALHVAIKDMVQHPDTHTADFTVVLQPKIVGWQPTSDGKSTINVTLAAMSLSKNGTVLTGEKQTVLVIANSQNSYRLAATEASLPMHVRIPRKMKTLNVAVQLADNGRIGTAEMDRRVIEAAPTAPSPPPSVQKRPPPN